MSATLILVRGKSVPVSGGEAFTPGELFYNGQHFAFTCEDDDRHLEDGENEKVYGRTCIPRGSYKVEVSWSPHFNKRLPAVLGVPGFSGIRFHGGNRAEDSLGCILIGKVRTSNGVAQCSAVVQRLIDLLDSLEDAGQVVTLEVK